MLLAWWARGTESVAFGLAGISLSGVQLTQTFFSFQSAFLATEIQTLLHSPKDIYNTKTSKDR